MMEPSVRLTFYAIQNDPCWKDILKEIEDSNIEREAQLNAILHRFPGVGYDVSNCTFTKTEFKGEFAKVLAAERNRLVKQIVRLICSKFILNKDDLRLYFSRKASRTKSRDLLWIMTASLRHHLDKIANGKLKSFKEKEIAKQVVPLRAQINFSQLHKKLQDAKLLSSVTKIVRDKNLSELEKFKSEKIRLLSTEDDEVKKFYCLWGNFLIQIKSYYEIPMTVCRAFLLAGFKD